MSGGLIASGSGTGEVTPPFSLYTFTVVYNRKTADLIRKFTVVNNVKNANPL